MNLRSPEQNEERLFRRQKRDLCRFRYNTPLLNHHRIRRRVTGDPPEKVPDCEYRYFLRSFLKVIVYVQVFRQAYCWPMSARRWVLKCKKCRAECAYAEIPLEGFANYFFPKKPQVPDNFTYTCPRCAHRYAYERADLIYQDNTIAPSSEAAKCS